mgnify:CR=1 FL=1|jgi:hypothetical protein
MDFLNYHSLGAAAHYTGSLSARLRTKVPRPGMLVREPSPVPIIDRLPAELGEFFTEIEIAATASVNPLTKPELLAELVFHQLEAEMDLSLNVRLLSALMLAVF